MVIGLQIGMNELTRLISRMLRPSHAVVAQLMPPLLTAGVCLQHLCHTCAAVVRIVHERTEAMAAGSRTRVDAPVVYRRYRTCILCVSVFVLLKSTSDGFGDAVDYTLTRPPVLCTRAWRGYAAAHSLNDLDQLDVKLHARIRWDESRKATFAVCKRGWDFYSCSCADAEL